MPRMLPRQRRGGRGSASPLHRWGSMLAVGSVGQGVVGDPPCCRGQAVPDPPARLGRNRRRERVPTVACAIPAGMVAGTDVAAPEARRARQRLAPTQVGRASPVGRMHTTVRRCALRPVGVRRCLTRWPGRASRARRAMMTVIPGSSTPAVSTAVLATRSRPRERAHHAGQHERVTLPDVRKRRALSSLPTRCCWGILVDGHSGGRDGNATRPRSRGSQSA